MSVVEKINDLVYNFQRNNHYYPGCLYIGVNQLESLIREVEDQLHFNNNSTTLSEYQKMRIVNHANVDALYVQ